VEVTVHNESGVRQPKKDDRKRNEKRSASHAGVALEEPNLD
jgi:hypothetical protein